MTRPLEPGSPPRGTLPRVPAGLEEDLRRGHPRLPLEDSVHRDVGEEQKPAFLVPDWPFGPVVPFGEFLHLGAWRDQLIDPGVEALDGPQGCLGGRSALLGVGAWTIIKARTQQAASGRRVDFMVGSAPSNPRRGGERRCRGDSRQARLSGLSRVVVEAPSGNGRVGSVGAVLEGRPWTMMKGESRGSVGLGRGGEIMARSETRSFFEEARSGTPDRPRPRRPARRADAPEEPR